MNLIDAAIVALACVPLLIFLIGGLATLSKAALPRVKGEETSPSLFSATRKLGARIMSVLDDALARFTAFVQGVLDQVKAARETNDAQTAKLTELQDALNVALADDADDKATIANLQAEIANLQSEIADRINAAVDALENVPAPVEETVDAPVVDEVIDEVVEEIPFTEEVASEEVVVVDETAEETPS